MRAFLVEVQVRMETLGLAYLRRAARLRSAIIRFDECGEFPHSDTASALRLIEHWSRDA